MQQIVFRKRLVFTLVTCGFAAVAVFATAQPASARRGEDDMVAQTAQTQEQESEGETEASTDDSRRDQVKNRVSELKDDAKKELDQKKEGREQRTEEKRRLVCENRQKAIENKLSAFNQAADKHLAKLDSVFLKIQSYKTAENLTPSNWVDLVENAESKQEAATVSVAALKEVAVDVDCNDPETVVKLSEVREAATAARTALHDYRKALKDMVVALAQAKDDTSDDTDTTSGDDASGTSEAGGSNSGQEANE